MKNSKNFPTTFEVGGIIEVKRSDILLIRNSNDKVIGANILLTLETKVKINELSLENFEIKTSHRLSDFEFYEFMDKVMINK